MTIWRIYFSMKDLKTWQVCIIQVSSQCLQVPHNLSHKYTLLFLTPKQSLSHDYITNLNAIFQQYLFLWHGNTSRNFLISTSKKWRYFKLLWRNITFGHGKQHALSYCLTHPCLELPFISPSTAEVTFTKSHQRYGIWKSSELIGKLSLSAIRWVPICHGFSHFSILLSFLVDQISSKRLNIVWNYTSLKHTL